MTIGGRPSVDAAAVDAPAPLLGPVALKARAEAAPPWIGRNPSAWSCAVESPPSNPPLPSISWASRVRLADQGVGLVDKWFVYARLKRQPHGIA